MNVLIRDGNSNDVCKCVIKWNLYIHIRCLWDFRVERWYDNTSEDEKKK